MSYKQLTREQRYQISALKSAGHYQHQIARIVGLHQSTISRELRRNSGTRSIYGPQLAHSKALARRHAKVRTHIQPCTWQQVEALLEKQWSPEQISGRLKLEQKPTVSHERIYQHIYEDQRGGGTLYKHLRCQKLRRKRYASSKRRIPIPNRTSIDLRPQVVEQKKRIGDWEADTIVSKDQRGAILSLVERRSKLTRLKKVNKNGADEVSAAGIDLLRSMRSHVHTITSDNGREFCGHEQISKVLSAKFYFAHPYCSWERGLNENTNGLVRQYFPKKTDFSCVSDSEVKEVMERLNHRPRKTLGYRTPYEVFYRKKIYALTT